MRMEAAGVCADARAKASGRAQPQSPAGAAGNSVEVPGIAEPGRSADVAGGRRKRIRGDGFADEDGAGIFSDVTTAAS